MASSYCTRALRREPVGRRDAHVVDDVEDAGDARRHVVRRPDHHELVGHGVGDRGRLLDRWRARLGEVLQPAGFGRQTERLEVRVVLAQRGVERDAHAGVVAALFDVVGDGDAQPRGDAQVGALPSGARQATIDRSLRLARDPAR